MRRNLREKTLRKEEKKKKIGKYILSGFYKTYNERKRGKKEKKKSFSYTSFLKKIFYKSFVFTIFYFFVQKLMKHRGTIYGFFSMIN